MKKYLNEKGSFPIVLMIVLIMTISVVGFSSLYIAEKTNISFSATKDVKALYEEDSVIEITINTLNQLLRTKVYEELDGQYFVESYDLGEVEDMVNKDILPLYGLENYQVFLDEDYMPPTIDYFCSTDYEEDDLTFAGYECLREAFDIHLKLQLEKGSHVKQYVLEFNNLYPKISDAKDGVSIDTSAYAFKMTK